MDRIKKFMREVGEASDKRLENILPFADLRPAVLHEAMRYSVLGGGKRLRPVLTLAAFDAACGAPERRARALDAGLAIELLHAYSLVHDDLPAMDNDTMRRNRLTCHKAFGETIAILVGDALQALAFKTMAIASGEMAVETVVELGAAAGSTGMVGGQVLDFEGEGKSQILEDIERIDRWKTGSLFTCCCRIGGIMAEADDQAMRALTAYGDAIGVLYQISDDILDVTANQAKLGKTPGKDRIAGKLTYPAALGIEGASAMVAEKSAQAKHAIQDLGKEALHLRLLADFLLDRIHVS